MNDTQCIQWRSVNIIQRTTVQGSTHGTSTTTRHYQWGRRVWDRRSQKASKIRTMNSIFSALEGLWRWTWPVDHRNRVALCKRGNWRLLNKNFKLKSIKERDKNPDWQFQIILTSKSSMAQ